MIGHYWADATDVFLGWYFNLQTPLRRSTVGFDLWDQLLDIVVRPDRTWVRPGAGWPPLVLPVGWQIVK
jgi:hypothetical protein